MLSGFGNYHESEAVTGALPKDQNSPQQPPKGLYPEQLSGSAFTAPRKDNLRSWLYRIRPSVTDGAFSPMPPLKMETAPGGTYDPSQFRWKPFPYPDREQNLLESLRTFAFNGSPHSQSGCGLHMYACQKSMDSIYFHNADGDLLFVPQEGELSLETEFGILSVLPTEIAVIPKGIKFRVQLKGKKARGYVCENYGAHFILPDLGPIGSNGLANPRDFFAPVAQYDESAQPCTLITKFMGQFFSQTLKNSPLNVVAWHGNYYPYKYDLKKFNTINTVSFDHPDPSIFTVLTSPSGTPGVANIDFVIFPPRWMVAENTFRPPYYHRNVMSEFMGLVLGVYDAKSDAFAPGGGSLHNSMAPHGPDAETFGKATNSELKPERYKDTLAFMFESRYPMAVTEWALKSATLDSNYVNCWQDLKALFSK